VRGGQRWLRRHGSSVRGTDLKTQREWERWRDWVVHDSIKLF
jgi:hypothetical protein